RKQRGIIMNYFILLDRPEGGGELNPQRLNLSEIPHEKNGKSYAINLDSWRAVKRHKRLIRKIGKFFD
ncbi:hypothetical protein JXL19_09920, partial [bacterium]|nr:hypothetical protein [bacterium]